MFSDLQALLVQPESKHLTNYFHKASGVSVLKLTSMHDYTDMTVEMLCQNRCQFSVDGCKYIF